MTWFPIALIAQIILGTSAVFDKMLLKKSVFNPFAYTFWLGVLGLFSFATLPLGFEWFSYGTVILALCAGAIFMLAMLFLFFALHGHEASKSLLLIGALTPITTLVAGWVAGSSMLVLIDTIGFIFLLIGGFVLFVSEEKQVRGKIIFFSMASALCFGISNIMMKWVFEQGQFWTGFFWAKMGGVLLVLLFLLVPVIRQHIFSSAEKGDENKHHVLYFLNRGYAAVGSILIHVAIFFAHPALVEATQSVKYAVIFLASWFLLNEHFKGRTLIGKIIALCFVGVGLAWLAMGDFARNIPINPDRPIVWGLTFSQKFSRELGLDWKNTYTALIDELEPPAVRLVAYWDDVEKEKGLFDFSETDWLLEKTIQSDTRIILAVGIKAPRWPECHIPQWVKALTTEEREESLRLYLTAVIERYKKNNNIIMWQVENEPYLAFGDCPERGVNFLQNEVAVVKSLDTSRPILTTDGGEFGLWYKAAKEGDAFGTTMYRKTYPRVIGPRFGVIEYPLAPSYFRFKERVVRRILGDYTKPFFVIELQAEPWGPRHISQLTNEEQNDIFGPNYFKETIEYAKETGFNQYYLWGAEWWYWKKLQGDDRYWDIAKDLFHQN